MYKAAGSTHESGRQSVAKRFRDLGHPLACGGRPAHLVAARIGPGQAAKGAGAALTGPIEGPSRGGTFPAKAFESHFPGCGRPRRGLPPAPTARTPALVCKACARTALVHAYLGRRVGLYELLDWADVLGLGHEEVVAALGACAEATHGAGCPPCFHGVAGEAPTPTTVSSTVHSLAADS